MSSFSKVRKKSVAERSKMIIRTNILNNLKLEKAQLSTDTLMLDEFIGISRHSDLDLLQKLVKNIVPPDSYDNIYLKPLFESKEENLNLVWLQNEIPLESHDEHLESIFILEGSCKCYIDDVFIELEKGGFVQMPLGSKHSITATSTIPVKAILSFVKA